MEFKLPHQEISDEINELTMRKIAEEDVYFSRCSKKNKEEIEKVVQEIQQYGIPPYLVLKKLKKGLGSGIFLHPEAKPIARGRVIGPYAGHVSVCQQNYAEDSDYSFSLVSDFTLTKEEHGQFDPKSRYHPKRHYSVDLDAHKKGNFTRYINHSAKPNIEARLMKLTGTFEIIYVAKKTIMPGEQLMTCYEGEDKSYWGVMKIKPFAMTPQTFRLDAQLNVIQLGKNI